MAPRKMTMGKIAVISALISKLHPSEHIRAKWPYGLKSFRLENLGVLRQEMKKINRRDQMAIIMKHHDFQVDGKNIELYATQQFCTIKKEGHPDFFFTKAPSEENFEAEVQEIVPMEIQGMIQCGTLEPDDI
jgi:hypothetical protein